MANYSIKRDGTLSQVTIGGDLTASGVPELQAALKAELETGISELALDLGNASMLDSSGIGLLIAAANSLSKKQGKMRVLNVSAEIFHLLQSMRLTARLNVSGR